MSERIGVFGDSIVRGHCDYECGGWASQLQIKGFSDDTFSLFELGISGDTTEDLLKRVDVESAARSLSVIIYAIGLNDAARWNGVLRIDISQFKKNIARLHEINKKNGAKTVFIGLTIVDEKYSTPVSWEGTLHYLNVDIAEYDQVLRDYCKETDSFYIGMQGVIEEKDLADGVHPTSGGHKKMYEHIKKFLIDKKIIELS